MIKKDTITTEEAKKLVEKEKQERLNKCRLEIQEVLKKHNCRIDATVLVTGKGNIPQVSILPNEDNNR